MTEQKGRKGKWPGAAALSRRSVLGAGFGAGGGFAMSAAAAQTGSAVSSPAASAPIARSLLDFLPYERIAPILEGRSTWDASEALNRGIADLGPGAIFSPSGATYCFGRPLRLGRGTALRHLGSFDDTPGRGAILKLLPGANCPVVQTPAAHGGEATHYTCLEGFCIDGNGAEQDRSVPAGAVQWWGQFIGSEIKRIMIKNSRGPGLTLARGSDLYLEQVWIAGARLDPGEYAFDINPGLTGTGRSGALTMTHIFVENSSVRDGGDPHNREDDRGNGVRLSRLAAARIDRMHIEGMRRAVTIESCEQVDIGLLSGNWIGHRDDPDSAFVDLADAQTRSLTIAAIGCFTSGLPLVRKRQGVRSNFLPDMPAAALPFSAGYAATHDPNVGIRRAPQTLFANEIGIAKVGAASPIVLKLMAADDSTEWFGYMKQTGALTAFGTNIGAGGGRQRDFIILDANAAGGGTVELRVPLAFAEQNDAASGAAGTLLRSRGSLHYRRQASGASEPLVSLRVVEAEPAAPPESEGILLVAPRLRRVWLSVGTGSVADWLRLA